MHIPVASALIDIESELRQLSLWETQAPGPEALASTQPFAIDTLTLPQWLQFVFLPTMYYLIESEQPLPGHCGIAPMAEEYFRGNTLAVGGLIETLELVDQLLSGEQPDYSARQQRSSDG
ncbi:MAG: YqcC family protein [Congregibacter sp.]